MLHNLIYLLAGGAAGTLSRYALSSAVSRLGGTAFPLGTLAVNLTGCLLAGLLGGLMAEKISLSHALQLLLITGFLGGFTTFSALIIETSALWSHGQILRAALNIFLSITAGIVLFRAGIKLGEMIP